MWQTIMNVGRAVVGSTAFKTFGYGVALAGGAMAGADGYAVLKSGAKKGIEYIRSGRKGPEQARLAPRTRARRPASRGTSKTSRGVPTRKQAAA